MNPSTQNLLQRFVDAQESSYAAALSEIKNGKKTSHWMWYIFPQIQGLGFSNTSKFYAIRDLEEATAYLKHPILSTRLKEMCRALLQQPLRNAHAIFGSPDDRKLQSSMTLFAAVPGSDPVFEQVLETFFEGRKDDATLALLK